MIELARQVVTQDANASVCVITPLHKVKHEIISGISIQCTVQMFALGSIT